MEVGRYVKSSSVDLRTRVLAAVSVSASHRKAAERFGVSAASVIRWRNRQIEQGNVCRGPFGCDLNSGERLQMGFPHRHRKTTTLVVGRRNTGMVAPLVIDGPINGEWFEAYVGQVLVPTLKPGDIVILDNLSSHKRLAAREIIEAVGAGLMFLPPYNPDFNPIEKAFSKLKALLRKAAGRTISDLWDRIGKIVELIDPQEAQNHFTSCGYDPR
jgi:transposase